MTDFATYLRACRERLRPADVGLPDHGRRRTPGLRREEVAALAGVSVDYLVRLEQGRDANPSASVLNALSDALRLSDEERMHLGKLAARGHAPELCPKSRSAEREVVATVRSLLDSLEPMPAFVLGPTGDVLAWNAAWERLVRPLGFLDDEEPNLAHYVFAHSRARTVYPDWDAAADEQVSRLRTASIRWGEDERFAALLAALQAIPEFASRWSAHGVGEKRRGTKRLVHPVHGEIELAYEVLLLPDDGEQRLITWQPADEAAAAALAAPAALAAAAAAEPERPVSPARLRVVGDA
jgi:transcriptional regulator with XRE-family HTH domain